MAIEFTLKNKNGITLNTANKFVRENIIIKLDESIFPEGSLTISENGEYNVYDYSNVLVNVPLGTNTSDATATSNDILSGKTAYINGEKVEGSIETYDYSNNKNTETEIDKFLKGSFVEYYNDRITSISSTFGRQTNLKKLSLPNLVYTANDLCSGCAQLEEVYLPKLENTGISGFRNCYNLVYIKLDSAKNINTTCFYGCRKLETVYLPSVSKQFHSSLFEGCTNLKDIYIGCEEMITLQSTLVFKNAGTTQGYINIHVRSECVESYKNATNWTDLIDSGLIRIIGDYEEE